LLEIYKPESIRQLQVNLKTVKDLIKPENNTPSLGYLKNKVNETLAISLIKAHLLELSDYLNLTRGMTGAQIDITAEMILDEFPLIKIADMIYIFKQAKMGKFGALFEGLDGAKILSWFRQVFEERLNAGEYVSDREHENKKHELAKLYGDQRTCGQTSDIDKMRKINEEWLLVQMDKKPLTE
jgi:hypothetical protein